MGLLNFLAKITGVEKKVRWSKGKRITVEGPDFFGKYEIYVDSELNVALFLPKTDGTVHVLIGSIVGCNRYEKYDSACNQLSGEQFSKGVIDWKINPDRVLFRGRGLPPGSYIYEGLVVADELFAEEITDQWVRKKVRDITTYMNSK